LSDRLYNTGCAHHWNCSWWSFDCVVACVGTWVWLPKLHLSNSPCAENVYLYLVVLECRLSSAFRCENAACLPAFVKCDGYDHCGDGSDEGQLCGNTFRIYLCKYMQNYSFFGHLSKYNDNLFFTLLVSHLQLVIISIFIYAT